MNFYNQRTHRLAGVALLVVIGTVASLLFLQSRGAFSDTARLIVKSGRSGLVLDPGAKATFNGVLVGRVTTIDAVQDDGQSAARLEVHVDARYLPVMPANVSADVVASTIFGNKTLAFTAPRNPSVERISDGDVITATTVTTEFQTLFETVSGIAEKIDPVQLNLTLSAAAEALTGLGTSFGRSLTDANAILTELNPRIPQLREGVRNLTDRDWLKRVKKAGVDALLEGAAKASAFYSHGGAKVWAAGMVEAINRGHRNRLELAQ